MLGGRFVDPVLAALGGVAAVTPEMRTRLIDIGQGWSNSRSFPSISGKQVLGNSRF